MRAVVYEPEQPIIRVLGRYPVDQVEYRSTGYGILTYEYTVVIVKTTDSKRGRLEMIFESKQETPSRIY